MNKKIFTWNLLSIYRTELMGCSILGIILFHWSENCSNHGIPLTGFLKLFSLGNRVVDVFLILSGIGLYYSYRKNEDTKNFYIRRMFNILPSYCIIAMPYWIYYDLIFSTRTWMNVLLDFSFISFVTEACRRFWFIGLIIVLYLLFPAFYKIIYHWKNRWIGTALSFAVYLIFAAGLWKTAPSVYSNIEIALGRIPCFILGIFLGEKVYNKQHITKKPLAAAYAGLLSSTALIKFCRLPFLTNVADRSIEGIFYALSFLLILITLLAFIENLKIYSVIKILLCVPGRMTMEIYLLHVAFRSIFDYPADFTNYHLLIAASILLAFPIHKAGKAVSQFFRS